VGKGFYKQRMADTELYRVLARKYRPRNFDDLIGQDVLVRTLTNAFNSDRIAHAFLLTGIRGIGKTTTARIIARGLNCLGPDGNGGPTTSPCGVCSNCKMILEDRHVDIIEMDAASRTGVDDIRDIIETVHYAPAAARYKVYIIDEVHMLSKNAFNALLKTLEEPPEHVKFIFATTETRKIPITIVSRCQRFDLRRMDVDTLSTHLRNICDKEKVQSDEESLRMIAAAAEGSVRDSLSLLDQAIAMSSSPDGSCNLQADHTRQLLGLADSEELLKLIRHLFAGETAPALDILGAHYANGGDPLLALQDMLALTHYITRVQIDKRLTENQHFPPSVQQLAADLAGGLSVPLLARFWQMLLKGIEEVKQAAHPLQAAEMILIRMAYASQLPPPEKLIRDIREQQAAGGASAPAMAAPAAAAPAGAPVAAATMQPIATHGNLALAVAHQPHPVAEVQETEDVDDYESMLKLFRKNKEMLLYSTIFNDTGLVHFEPGKLILKPYTHIQADVAARIRRHLIDWTGRSWDVTFDPHADAEPSLREQAKRAKEQQLAYVRSHPDIQAMMSAFEGAEIIDVEPTGEDE
jgi:DNA polymerase-3 subunit gamma/tau